MHPRVSATGRYNPQRVMVNMYSGLHRNGVEVRIKSLTITNRVADYIDAKLINAIRFAPLAHIDNTLVGRPGDEVTLPQYA